MNSRCGAALHIFSNSSAHVVFACYIRFTCILLCPEQGFVVVSGCLVYRDQRSPVLCAVVFFTSIQNSSLLWFCLATCFWYFLLYRVIMFIQIYANARWVWILMFPFLLCLCLLSQVLVFDPVGVGRIEQGTEEGAVPTWNMVPNIHLAVPLLPRGALLFLLLFSCMVFSSVAESK